MTCKNKWIFVGNKLMAISNWSITRKIQQKFFQNSSDKLIIPPALLNHFINHLSEEYFLRTLDKYFFHPDKIAEIKELSGNKYKFID